MKSNPKARSRDREILWLAFPALVTLAAEPTCVLADTEIVGHLDTPEFIVLAVAVLSFGFGLVEAWGACFC